MLSTCFLQVLKQKKKTIHHKNCKPLQRSAGTTKVPALLFLCSLAQLRYLPPIANNNAILRRPAPSCAFLRPPVSAGATPAGATPAGATPAPSYAVLRRPAPTTPACATPAPSCATRRPPAPPTPSSASCAVRRRLVTARQLPPKGAVTQ